MASLTLEAPRGSRLVLILLSPAVAMFLSTNVANAGNLVFNMLFSRWMGPALFAELATLLTLKLSLLAILTAVQMAVSQIAAGPAEGRIDRALVWLNRALFALLALAVPLLLPSALSGALTGWLGLGSAQALVLLLFALPVTAPLCLARGIAIGRLEVGRIVASSNIEMAVRLGGAVLAWKAGLGLEGVVLALAASLVAGWLPVRGALTGKAARSGPVLRNIAALALPFAVLQAAQVAHLDGDVLVANLLLTREETGLLAVLSLFQRIQFFACFGLAAVLLPQVTAAVAAGRSGFAELRPVALLFAGLSLPLLAVLGLAPGTVITLLSGPAFAAAAPQLLAVGASAVLFTFSYLAATFLAATGSRRGIWLIAGFVPVQIGLYLIAHAVRPDFALADMTLIKLLVQAALAALLLGVSLSRLSSPRGLIH